MRGVISGLPDLVKLDEDPPDKDVCDREFKGGVMEDPFRDAPERGGLGHSDFEDER